MNLDEHLFLSALVAPLFIVLFLETLRPVEFMASYLIAVTAGTAIDLDHFLVMRIESGDWKDLRKALKRPLKIAEDYRELTIYSAQKKYLVHFFTISISLTLVNFISNRFLPLIAAMLGFHIFCDLIASYQKKEFPFGNSDPSTDRKKVI